MLAELERRLSVRSVLFGWNSRLHGPYSFLFQCRFHPKGLGIFIRILQTCAVFLDNVLHWHCPRTAFCSTLLCVSHIWLFFQLHIQFSRFCCSQYPSSQRVISVEVKFLPQIKCSEMKMLPQRVLQLVTLMETGPLAGLAEAPHFPKTGVKLHPVMRQWGWLADLKPRNQASSSL